MVNYVGLFTLVRRELKRTLMVINQVIWPPVIMTLLFLFIFGLSLGSRIKTLGGVSYVEFLMPGLVMLNVISSSYDEAASSIFQHRFMNSIQELLVAPLSYVELLVGFLIGSVLRGVVIGSLVMVIGVLVVHVVPENVGVYLFFMIMTALLFSAIGLVGGLLAKTWDNLAIVNTFIITPLTYVGGVFTSLALLPPLVQRFALVNPMQYMVDGFRFSYTGSVDIGLAADAAVVTALAIIVMLVAFDMMRRGVNLRV